MTQANWISVHLRKTFVRLEAAKKIGILRKVYFDHYGMGLWLDYAWSSDKKRSVFGGFLNFYSEMHTFEVTFYDSFPKKRCIIFS